MANNNINLFERYWYDAMANLGQSLGQRSADNAARRQGIKSRDAIDELLENSERHQQIEEIANMNKLQAAEAAKEHQKAVSVTGNIPGYNGFDLKSGTILDPQFSLSKATPDGRSVQDNAVDEVLDLKRMGAYPITAEQQTAGKQLEKLGQYPMNVNVSEQNADETDNSQAARLGDVVSPKKTKLGWTNITADDVREDLRKRGIDEDIIDKELLYFKDKIKTRARDQFLPEIMDGLYGYTNKEGEYVAPTAESYRNANEKLMLLKQYDQDTANTLLSGSITPRDIYTENRQKTVYEKTRNDLLKDRQDERGYKKQASMDSIALKREAEKQQFIDKVTLLMEVYDIDYKTAEKLVLGGSGTGRGNGGSGLPGSVSTQQLNAAKDEIKAFNDWQATNPGVDAKTYPRYNQLNYAYQINDAALGYGGNNGGSNSSFDWNNWDTVAANAQEARDKGESWENILAVAKQNMGDGEMYRELERLAKQNEGNANSKQQKYADEYLANAEKEKLAQEQYNYGQSRNQAARAGLYVDTRGKVWPMNPSYFNPNSDDGKANVELYNQWAHANGLPAWGQ